MEKFTSLRDYLGTVQGNRLKKPTDSGWVMEAKVNCQMSRNWMQFFY